MATKKTAAAETVIEETVAEAVAEEPVQAAQPEPIEVDPWSIMEEMLVPRKPKGDDPTYYVSVNNRSFFIPANGKVQKLPKPIAGVLKDSLEAEVNAEEFAENMPKQFS